MINGFWWLALDVLVTRVYISRQSKNYLLVYRGACVMLELVRFGICLKPNFLLRPVTFLKGKKMVEIPLS